MKLKFTTISVVTVILTLCSNGFGMDYFEQGHSNISQNMTVLNKELADAITNNKMEDICRLIQYGADVDTRGVGQTTALIRAVEHEDINMVRWLLDKGADANLGELKRVMSVYMGNGNTIINKFVQENEQRIDTPLIKAIEMGNLSIITMLVDNGADVNDQEPLRYAVMNSVNVDIISYLVKKGANVKNHDILCEAIGSLRYDRNSMNIVKRLIEYKDSLNISCSSALEVALSRLFDIRFNDSGNTEAINDLEETIKLILSDKIDREEQVKIIYKFLRSICMIDLQISEFEYYFNLCGGDISNITQEGTPLLTEALRRCNLNLADWLIKHGADINATSYKGQSFLILSAQGYNGNMVKWLVEHGANINVKDQSGQTALNYFAQRYNSDMVKWLVEHGADINAKDQNDQTALIYFAQWFDADMIKWLIEHGADSNVRDQNGRSVLDFAREEEDSDMVSWLMENNCCSMLLYSYNRMIN